MDDNRRGPPFEWFGVVLLVLWLAVTTAWLWWAFSG
jgi:hypothetical protein